MAEVVEVRKVYEQSDNTLKPPGLSGWKTKYGTIILVIGTAILGGAGVAPTEEIGTWMTFIGTIITGAGTALTGWGIGHKLEKNKPVINVIERTDTPKH